MLHACFDFNVCFFKSFAIHIIFRKFGSNIWHSPNWLENLCALLILYMLIIIKGSKFSCSKYYGQILFRLVFFKLTELHCISMLTFSKCENNRFWDKTCSKNLWMTKFWKNFEKLHIKTGIIIKQCSLVSNFRQFGEH